MEPLLCAEHTTEYFICMYYGILQAALGSEPSDAGISF